MTGLTIALAGRKVEILPLHPPQMEWFFRDYLCDGPADFRVQTTMEDIIYERNRSAREDRIEGREKRKFPNAYLETLSIYRKIAVKMLDYDTLLFHGSAISVDGQGYLFTAKSGTGKSTHSQFWRETFGDRLVDVNDDKPLLQICGDQVLVCGTPWNGKHDIGNPIQVPLKAICILRRSEENHIEPLTKAQALPMLIQQSYRPEDPVALGKMLGVLEKLTERTGLYALGCNLDPKAATVAYEGMNRKEDSL